MTLCTFIGLSLLTVCFLISASNADSGALWDVCPAAPLDDQRKLFTNGSLCKNPKDVTAVDFKTSVLNHAGNLDGFLRSSVNIVTATEFPGLNTLGLSMGRTDIAMDGMVLPHSHPRASEMMYVARGTILAGFLDTKGQLFQRTLEDGEVFVFPRGLPHFTANAGPGLAIMYSLFSTVRTLALSASPEVAALYALTFLQICEGC